MAFIALTKSFASLVSHQVGLFNPFTTKFSQKQISTKCPNFILWNFEKKIAPCVSSGRELSFEWSHQRISSTDSKVRVTSQNSIKHSGSERVNPPQEKRGVNKPTTPQRATRTTSLTLKAVQERNLCFQGTLRQVPSPSRHATLLWMKRCVTTQRSVWLRRLLTKGETENLKTIIHSCKGKSKVKYVSIRSLSLTGRSSWDDLHTRQALSARFREMSVL